MASSNGPIAVVLNPAGKHKLRGAKKAAFLKRMAKGRAKANGKSAARTHRPKKSAYNGRKKKKPATTAPRTKSNPGVFTFMANGHKSSGKKKKKKSKYNGKKKTRPATSRRAKSNPRGASASKAMSITKGGPWAFARSVAAAGGGFLAANILPETALPAQNTGLMGYGLQAIVTGAGAVLLYKFAKPSDGFAFGIGGGLAMLNRGVEDLASVSIVDARSINDLIRQGVDPAVAAAQSTTVSGTGMGSASQRRWSLRGMAGSYQAATFPTPQGQQWPGQRVPQLNAPPAPPPAAPNGGKSQAMAGVVVDGGFAGRSFFA